MSISYKDNDTYTANRKRRRKQKHKAAAALIIKLIIFIMLFICIISIVRILFSDTKEKKLERLKKAEIPEWIDVELIDIDGHARRGEKLDGITDIVIHYVGNPGTTAMQNRNYFNNEGTDVSSHFIVGLDGEIVQCVPIDEKSSASNWRNNDTISIEVCHPDETGEFSETTRESLIKLASWICRICDLDEDNIIRHYDVNGKLCPIYYVENEDEWTKLKQDIIENK